MRIVIRNDFHHTKATIAAKSGAILSASRIARVRAKLCGSRDCTCHNSPLGDRGPTVAYDGTSDPKAYRVDFEEIGDGTVRVLISE